MFWKRKIETPKTNETQLVDVVQLWEVHWTSRTGEWQSDLKKEAEFFTSEKEANDFAESLRQAFKLVKNRNRKETEVEVVKRS